MCAALIIEQENTKSHLRALHHKFEDGVHFIALLRVVPHPHRPGAPTTARSAGAPGARAFSKKENHATIDTAEHSGLFESVR
jgi:hypothetical protein